MSDLLLGRFFGNPSDDVNALDAGQVVTVAAFNLDGGRRRHGRMLVTPANPYALSWEPRKLFRGYGEGMDFPTPYTLTGSGGVPRGLKWMFREITFSAADGGHRLAVPLADLPLVERAITGRR